MNPQKSNRLALAGVLTAVGASLCCITPVLALVAGITGTAATFSWLEPARPYLIGITLLILGFAWYQKLQPAKADNIACACEGDEKPAFWQSKKLLVLVTVFAAVMLAFPYYADVFYPSANNKEIIVVQADHIKTARFSISGMTCQGCAAHVENEVNKLQGIVSVKASYENADARVAYDKSKVALADIEAAINRTGYTVTANQTITHSEK